jgi:hypothetical protein
MPLPRPASPKALVADFRAFIAERQRHQLVAAVLALLMPLIIVVLFITDARTNTAPPEQLIYVKSWRADRTDEEIKADQKKAQAERQAQAEERQRQYQKLADLFGIE